MADYKLKTGKMGQAVVGAYQKVEDGVVGGYKKIENAFVDAFLEKTEPTKKETFDELKNINIGDK